MEPVAGNQQAAAVEVEHGQTVTPLVVKGAWNAEEDAALRKLIKLHGLGKWAGIARDLPGRTRKQCLERWANNLRPGIEKKNFWTREEDIAFIEAHKVHGNEWASIADCLTGRSENSVKNHWNSTMRSLGAKRWVKKKKSGHVPFGRVTILEEYILGLHKTANESELLDIPSHEELEAFTNTINMPGGGVMDGGLVYPPVLTPSAIYNNPPEMGMYTNPTSLTTTQEMQEYNTAYNELQETDNLHSFIEHVNWPMPQDMSSQDHQGTNVNFNHPLSENVEWQPSDQGTSNMISNEDEGGHIDDNVSAHDFDVLQMTSMNMYSPEYDASIDPTMYI